MLFVMKTLVDERYIVIKAYKLTVFENLSDFSVLSYIVCSRYPIHIESAIFMMG